jgi:hypothetical protein
MDITMGFFRLQFAETKQVPRVTRAAPVKEALLDLLGSFQSRGDEVISPTRSEKNWSFLLIGWRFGT